MSLVCLDAWHLRSWLSGTGGVMHGRVRDSTVMTVGPPMRQEGGEGEEDDDHDAAADGSKRTGGLMVERLSAVKRPEDDIGEPSRGQGGGRMGAQGHEQAEKHDEEAVQFQPG